MTTLSGPIRQRYDTAANWTSNNPTLLAGEQGWESDTGKSKLGDGSTVWTSLGYLGGAGSGDMLAANNLSDVVSKAAARVNLEIDKRTTFSNAPYTILATDKVVSQIGTMSASRAVTLPAASAVNAGKEIVIVDRSGSVTAANSLVVTRAGADLIDGATSHTIARAYGMVRLVSDGSSAWTVLGASLGKQRPSAVAITGGTISGVAISGATTIAQSVNAQTGTTYTLVAADASKLVTLSNAAAITLTVPQDSAATIAVGTYVDLYQLGAGQVTVAAGAGATLRTSGLTAKARAQYSRLGVQKVSANTWSLFGDLAAS